MVQVSDVAEFSFQRIEGFTADRRNVGLAPSARPLLMDLRQQQRVLALKAWRCRRPAPESAERSCPFRVGREWATVQDCGCIVPIS